MPPNDYYGEFTRDFFGYMEPDDMQILQSVFGILIGIVVFCAIVGLALYILQAIGVMRMAGNRGMSYPWMAWIPVLSTFMIGALADDINEKQNGSKSYYRFFLLGGIILSYVISGTYTILVFSSLAELFRDFGDTASNVLLGVAPLINLLQYPISIATLVFLLMSLYKIYKCYTPKNATAFTVLSFFFSFLISIFLFVLRNREPVPVWQSAPGYYPPPMGYPPADYPPTGYPPADYPPTGYPPTGYPPTGYPPAGYPPAGYPPTGYPPTTFDSPYPPGYPPQDQGYPPPQDGGGEEPPAN